MLRSKMAASVAVELNARDICFPKAMLKSISERVDSG